MSAAFSEIFTQSGAIGSATFTTASALPAGLTLATNGTLSGIPTQTGSFPIVVTVTDANSCTGTSATYTLVIACQTITVTNPANPNGTVSSPFSETFTQTGAVGGATFTTASSLPAGLTLATNGVLSGTPTQSGSFPIVVTVTDGNSCTGTSATYNLVIACQTITVTNPANTAGTANSPFSETFTQTGAIGSATFTTASALPAGITLATNGVLSGTPTQTGSFPIDVTVTDANSCTGSSATYTLVIGCQTINVTNPANTAGTASSAFSETFTQTGAIGSATFTTASTLPAGLTLATNGVLSGTPTQTGSFPIVVTVTDSNGCTGTSATYTLVIACQTITVNNPANANGTAASPFSETFTATGAIGATTFTLASGTLPAGLTLAPNGVISGTPTQTGSFGITVTATDANLCTGTSATYTIIIGCQTITVTNPANTAGTVSAAFSETFTQTGAIGTATFTTASTLPAGLTLATNGGLSGTPTEDGSFPIVVVVTDSNGCTGTSATYTLVIGCQTITVTNPVNTNGTVSSAFSETFTQSDAVGGATFTTASTLPAGLTLATNGVLSGIPTQVGSFPIVVVVTDSNGCTGTGATYNLVIACQTITVTNPANATGPAGSPFSETFTQTGAIGTATFTTASTLPTGLSLSTAGVLSGTPTQGGTFPIVVTVTDSNLCTGTSATYNLIITCPVITVTNPANTAGTAGSAFSETFTQAGGQGTITFTTASTLPAGLTLSTAGVLSGTPTQTGSFPIDVTATDQNGCVGTGSTYTLVIGCQTITVNNPGVSTGVAAAPFSQTFTQTSAIGGAAFTLNSGTLPAGLSLATNGTLSGTPTQTGSFPITVLVTDGNSCTGVSATYNLTITCQTITVTNPAITTGTVNAAFSQTFTQAGAIGSATFTTASTLPAGLTLSTAGVLSGTPSEDGTFPIVVTVTDSNGCTGNSATYNLVIACQTITVTNPANANGTVSSPFSETFTQSGALGGATFTTASTLPAGLTLSTAGVLSGTPTQDGSFPIVVTVTDGQNACTGTSATYNLVIACQVITVTNPGVTAGTVDAAFSETFTQVGAVGTATFTTSSTLPSGLTLATNGVLSGTPGQPGSFPIVVTVTDSNGCTGTSATYTLVIACQTITVTNPGVTAGTVDAPFSQTFTQTGVGTHTPATFTTSSTLPSGLTLSTAGVLSGTPGQPGTFPIVVTVTDVNGCTGTGATYNLVIACQVITVNNPGVTTATYNTAFSQTFTQTGVGTHTPATFTTSSTLPTGLSLSTAGVLSGTPTQTGTFPINVTVTDANACTGTNTTYTLSVLPVATNDSISGGVDNTQLVLTGGTTATPGTPTVQVAGTIKVNDLPSAATVTVVSGVFATTAGGSVTVAADGTFLYTPPVNSAAAAITSDTFQYTVTSNTGGTGPTTSAPGTVTINLIDRVWFVRNNAAGGGNGQSHSPFNTLTSAQTASTANDFIFVHLGDGTTLNQNAGILLKNGQKLIGQGVALIVNGSTLVTAGTQPQIGNSGGVGVTATNLTGAVEIRGLNIGGTTDAITVSTNVAGSTNISNNTIRSAGTEGIDIDVTANAVNLTVSNNTITSTGTAIDINQTGGTATINAFASNSVNGNTVGSGVVVTNATFDATTGGGINVVNAGSWTIGASGNGVGASGMVLTNVAGSLSFTDLDVYAEGGAALSADGAASILTLSVTANQATLVATGGAAASITDTALDLQLNAMSSTNSAANGINLTNTTGTFSAPSGSTITNSTAADVLLSNTSAAFTYNGTITDDQGQLVTVSSCTGTSSKLFTGAITDGDDGDGSGITISGNSAGTTIRFSGGVVLSTGSAAAFSSSGPGIVEVCDENPCNPGATGVTINKITTTTGTALNVATTTIGSNNLEFRSISSNGAPSGIILNGTGSSGGLKVKGDGGGTQNASGGTIQNSTGVGISLTNTRDVSLTQLNLANGGNHGINISSVTNFTYQDAVMTGVADSNDEQGINILNLFGSSLIEDVTMDDIEEDGIQIRQNATDDGTADTITIRRLNVQDHVAGFGETGIEIQPDLASNLTVLVDDSDFAINTNAIMGVAWSTAASHTGTFRMTVQDSIFNCANAFGSGAVQALGGGSGTVFSRVHNNQINSTKFTGILLNADGNQTTHNTVTSNIITGSGATNNGRGIEMRQDENSTMFALVTNNNITQVKADGIKIYAQDATVDDAGLELQATILNNAATVRSDGFGAGIIVEVGVGDAFFNDACVDVTGNTVAGTDTTAYFDSDIVLNINDPNGTMRVKQTEAAVSSGNSGANFTHFPDGVFPNPPAVIVFNGGDCTDATAP
ncbi:MAG: putative Ig domain-containing protein [Acidobacteriota bacterium]|nr:putative Ig domain-containing protein [Acidobacteriota bacterium]